jgi:hypothetical protein
VTTEVAVELDVGVSVGEASGETVGAGASAVVVTVGIDAAPFVWQLDNVMAHKMKNTTERIVALRFP